MKLVEEKSGNGVRWVVEGTEGERGLENARSLDFARDDKFSRDDRDRGGTEGERAGVGSGKSPLLAQNGREKWGTRGDGEGVVIPWLMAMADPGEEWWRRLRNNPKGLGEVSQAAFLLKARTMGYKVAIPWGDSEPFDFVVWAGEGATMYRVQVKGTGRLYRRGYEVQPVHSTRRRGKRRYTAKEIDVVAAHVQPVDVWYLLPIGAVGRAKSLRFYPDIKSRRPMWEEYREGWEVLGDPGRGR